MLKFLPDHLLDIKDPATIDRAVDALQLGEITSITGLDFSHEQYRLLLKCALMENFHGWNQEAASTTIKLAGAILSFEQRRLFLADAVLQHADLHGANLRKAFLHKANLRGADLHDSNLQVTNLHDANLQDAILHGASLQRSNLQGANLQVANLQNANLQDAILQNAILQGANLQLANLQNANLYNANLLGSDLFGVTLTGTNLQSAILQGANLQGANLQNANLKNANLQNAILQGANLQNTNLLGAKLDHLQREIAKKNGALIDDPLDKVEADADNSKVENLIEKLNQDLRAQKENYETHIRNLTKDQQTIIEQEVKRYKDELAKQAVEQKIEFESAKDIYLKPIIDGLDHQQRKMFRFGVGCFILGIIVLVAAAGFIYYDLQACMDLFSSNLLAMDLFANSSETNTLEIVIRSSRLLAGLLLLAALARYFYMLGKSFMHESVVSSERLHALNFSQFFMRAFPVPDSYKDRKDIFAEWNKERSSAFHNLKPYDIDPRLIEMVSTISSIVRGEDKKPDSTSKV